MEQPYVIICEQIDGHMWIQSPKIVQHINIYVDKYTKIDEPYHRYQDYGEWSTFWPSRNENTQTCVSDGRTYWVLYVVADVERCAKPRIHANCIMNRWAERKHFRPNNHILITAQYVYMLILANTYPHILWIELFFLCVRFIFFAPLSVA